MISAVGAGLAALLALAAFAGTGVTALAVALVQGLLVAGWARAARVPDQLVGAALAGVAGLAVDLLVLFRHGPRPLVPVALVLGPAVVAAFLHQLIRRPPRAGVTASLTATVTLLAVAALAALHVAARSTRGGAPLVAAVAAGALGAAAVSLVRWPIKGEPPATALNPDDEPAAAVDHPRAGSVEPVLRALAAGVMGGIAGAVVGLLTALGLGHGLWLGATAGVVAAVGRALADDATGNPAEPATVLVLAALPVALTGPVSYVLGRILVG